MTYSMAAHSMGVSATMSQADSKFGSQQSMLQGGLSTESKAPMKVYMDA